MTQAEMLTPGLHASGILAGKRGLVLGVANSRSIAWGIAKAAREAGAELAFTYQGESLEKRVRPLAQELGAKIVGDCDVTDTAALNAVFKEIERIWGNLDFVVHCVAFSDKDQLTGRYIDTTTENFVNSLGGFLLFLHRGGPARRKADAKWRRHVDPYLLRGGKMDAAL